jgi:hypothetical protein
MKLVLMLSLALSAACSSSTNNIVVAGDGGPGDNPSDAGGTNPPPPPPADAASDAPAAGPYPTDHIGTNARAGTKPGDRIQNFSFQGYRANATTVTTISLGDFYDPQKTKYDVVIILADGAWDTFRTKVLDAIKPSTRRIATLAVLGEGTSVGTPSKQSELDAVRPMHPFANHVLDAGFAKLGVFFDAAALPFIAFIDARTMEIDTAGVGAITTTADIDNLVDAITSRPPAY